MSPDGVSTHDRILRAATEVFLEVGYRKATFREICRRAEANTAAINYHFRDKEGLYLAVLEGIIAEYQQRRDRETPPPSMRPEDRLRAYIGNMLTNLLGPGASIALFTVMSREMAEPTKGLDLMLEKVIRPFDREMTAIVRELLGPEASEQQLHDCVQCIVGQCNHFRRANAVIARLGYYETYDAQAIQRLIDQITRFSLAGILATCP